MHEEFKVGLTKKYGVTDNGFILGKDIYPFSACSYIKIFQAPMLLKCGMADVTVNGKNHTLSIHYNDVDRTMNAFNFMNQKIDEEKNVLRTYKYHIFAHTGTDMEVYDDYLTIDLMPNRGYVANATRGAGNGKKRINFSDITTVHYHEPTNTTCGFIQFSYPGSVECTGSFDKILNDENAIPVRYSEANLAREIVDFVEQKRTETKNDTKSSPTTLIVSTSAADELKKFKELLDMGIITQEEFDAKKKELLGL